MDSQKNNERDFAIDILHLLNQNFEGMKEVVLERDGGKGMDRELFVTLFKWYVRKCKKHRTDLSFGFSTDDNEISRLLLQLHCNIDCYCRGYVTWDELISFLIDTTMQGREGEYCETVKNYTYYGSLSLKGSKFHGSRYLPGRGKLIALGRHCELFEFKSLDSTETEDDEKEKKKKLSQLVSNPLGSQDSAPTTVLPSVSDRSTVSAAEYIPELHSVVLAVTDLTLRFCESWRGCKQKRVMPVPDTILALRYVQRSGFLYAGGRSGVIRMYVAAQLLRENSDIAPHMMSTPHTCAITEVLTLPGYGEAGGLATSSLDGTLAILDGLTLHRLILLDAARITADLGKSAHLSNQSDISFTTNHNLGITRMALLNVGDDGTTFLITCGYEPHAKAWLIQSRPSLPLPLIDGHSPHAAPVVDVAAVHAVPHCLTLDGTGVLKVWDNRDWKPCQTIKLCTLPGVTELTTWHSISYDLDMRVFCATASRTQAFFCYGIPGPLDTITFDDEPISALCYDPVRSVIITACGASIKTWNALTGELTVVQHHSKASFGSITALAISDTGRKLFAGTESGRVTSHNSCSCVLIRVFSSCGEEVHSLSYGSGRQFLIVQRWDGTAQIYMDTASGEGGTLTNLSVDPRCFPSIDIRCLSFSDTLNRLAIGDRKGFITLFEAKVRRSEDFNVITQFEVPPHGSEIIIIEFLTGFPLLVSVDASGQLCLWSLPPHPSPFKLLCLWKCQSVVHSISWYWVRQLVYCGTAGGSILKVSLEGMLRQMGMTVFASSLSYAEQLYKENMFHEAANPDEISTTGFIIEKEVILRPHSTESVSITHTHCDPLSKIVLVGATDRSITLWSCNLVLIGQLDQLQHSPYNVPVTVADDYCTPFGDKVILPGSDDIPGEETVSPFEELPGAKWFFRQGYQQKSLLATGAMYAVLGGSCLQFCHDTAITQGAFRTCQCNVAIVKNRGLQPDPTKVLEYCGILDNVNSSEGEYAPVSLRRRKWNCTGCDAKGNGAVATHFLQKQDRERKSCRPKRFVSDNELSTRPMRAMHFGRKGRKEVKKILKSEMGLRMGQAVKNVLCDEYESSYSSCSTDAVSMSVISPANAALSSPRSLCSLSSGRLSLLQENLLPAIASKSVNGRKTPQNADTTGKPSGLAVPSAQRRASAVILSSEIQNNLDIENSTEDGLRRRLSSFGLSLLQVSNSNCHPQQLGSPLKIETVAELTSLTDEERSSGVSQECSPTCSENVFTPAIPTSVDGGLNFVVASLVGEVGNAAERRRTIEVNTQLQKLRDHRKSLAGPDKFVLDTSVTTARALQPRKVFQRRVITPSEISTEPDKRLSRNKKQVIKHQPGLPAAMLAEFSTRWGQRSDVTNDVTVSFVDDTKNKDKNTKKKMKPRLSQGFSTRVGSIHWERFTAAAATKNKNINKKAVTPDPVIDVHGQLNLTAGLLQLHRARQIPDCSDDSEDDFTIREQPQRPHVKSSSVQVQTRVHKIRSPLADNSTSSNHNSSLNMLGIRRIRVAPKPVLPFFKVVGEVN